MFVGIVAPASQVAAHPVAPPGVPPPACVCSVPAALFSHGEGTLTYLPTGETIGFPPRCQLGAADSSVMRNRNPTCDIRTYVRQLRHHFFVGHVSLVVYIALHHAARVVGHAVLECPC